MKLEHENLLLLKQSWTSTSLCRWHKSYQFKIETLGNF
jgi:hypothetical protein